MRPFVSLTVVERALCKAECADVPNDPWYIVSDEPTSQQTLNEFGLRFDIEETFLDDKSGGFPVQSSELQTPEALERLFEVLAIATLHFTSIGLEVVRADDRRWVDTHWDRGLSYFKSGWRRLAQQYRWAWQAFATVWQDAGTRPRASARVTPPSCPSSTPMALPPDMLHLSANQVSTPRWIPRDAVYPPTREL